MKRIVSIISFILLSFTMSCSSPTDSGGYQCSGQIYQVGSAGSQYRIDYCRGTIVDSKTGAPKGSWTQCRNKITTGSKCGGRHRFDCD